MKNYGNNTILVVDDEEDIIELMTAVLSEKGIQVHSANNGNEALRKIGQDTIDIVITDISMPDMEGIELIKKLHQSKPHLPIIVMSGNAIGKRFLHAAKKFGASASLLKPFSIDELMTAVSAFL